MKFIKLLQKLILFVFMAAPVLATAAGTTYNFSFTTANGIGASGAFVLPSTFTQGPTGTNVSYSGGITSAFDTENNQATTGVSTGAFTGFKVNYSGPAWLFTFNVGAIAYTVDFANRNYTSNKALSYRLNGANTDTVSAININSGPTAVVAPVPEIDGDKLPQALMLIGALFFFFRSWKKSSVSNSPQFA